MAPLCKGSCQPERLTEGLFSEGLGASTDNPSVSAIAEPPPFTQGRLKNCLLLMLLLWSPMHEDLQREIQIRRLSRGKNDTGGAAWGI